MIWLDKDELQFLTGYKRKSDQVKALAELGIPFRQRPADGFPLVQRAHGIALGPEAVRLLEAVAGDRERVGRVFLYAAPVKGGEGKTRLRPITGTFNTAAFRKARKRAGLGKVRWHDLRHTFASWLAAEGASDRVLQAMGGWSSPRMLQKYAHLRADDTRAWANVIGVGTPRIEGKK